MPGNSSRANNSTLCLCLRAVVYPSSALPHLEDGVVLLVLRAVPSCVLPGDLKPLGFSVQPDKAGIHTAIYLGYQPWLQANSARVQRHCLQKRGIIVDQLLKVS